MSEKYTIRKTNNVLEYGFCSKILWIQSIYYSNLYPIKSKAFCVFMTSDFLPNNDTIWIEINKNKLAK